MHIYNKSTSVMGSRSTGLMSSVCRWRSEGDESGSVWASGGRSHEPNQARRARVNAAEVCSERTPRTTSPKL